MKNLLLLSILISIIFFPVNVKATDYYIADSASGGSDSNNGLSGTDEGGGVGPWETIAKVNDFAEATGFSNGDTINLNKGDTWSSDEGIGWDNNYIDWGTINGLTIQAYGTGANPKLDTNTQRGIIIDGNYTLSNLTIKDIDIYGSDSSYFQDSSVILIKEVNGVTIDGVDGDGRGDGLVDRPDNVIKIAQCIGNIEVKNCNLNGWGPQTNPTVGSGIDTLGVLVNNAGTAATGTVKIHGNTIHSMQSDAVQIVVFEGAVDRKAEIYGNTFYNCGENGIDIKNSSYVDIYSNTLYRNNWGPGGSDLGYLIVLHSVSDYLPKVCSHINIYQNDFTGNYDGSYDRYGIGSNAGAVNNSTISNNDFTNIPMPIYLARGSFQIHNNNYIYNKIINAYSSKPWGITLDSTAGNVYILHESMYAISTSTMTRGLNLQNNNAVARNNNIQIEGTDKLMLYTGSYEPDTDSNTYYNSLDSERVSYNSETNFSTYSGTAGHTNEKSRDPKFNAPGSGDLSLASDSNEINAGAWLTTITSASSTQTTFTVNDSLFFYPGDDIKTANGQTGTISTINYGTDQITLTSAISVVQNEGIGFDYANQAPDRGYIEYQTPPPGAGIENPAPANGATGIAVSIALTWTNGGSTTDVDVYFDDTDCTTQVVDGLDVETYDPPGDLANSDIFYWKVVANPDGENISFPSSGCYTFTTVGTPPNLGGSAYDPNASVSTYNAGGVPFGYIKP